MPQTYAERRAALEAMAARRALAGAGPQAVWAPLARLTAAELLCAAVPHPPGPIDLAAELAAVCQAAGTAVRRRSGWLQAAVPAVSLPVPARPRLVQAAVLCVLAGALRAGTPALLRCEGAGSAVLLVLHGGRGGAAGTVGPAPALLRRLAAESGGSAVFLAGPRFAAALRLPFAAGQCRPARPAEELLADRYSLLYQFSGPFCAGPWL